MNINEYKNKIPLYEDFVKVIELILSTEIKEIGVKAKFKH